MIKFSKIFLIIFLSVLMFGCQTMKKDKKINAEENESLIDSQKIVTEGQKSMDKKVLEGPKPRVLKKTPEVKRKTLTEEKVQNYVSIPDTYTQLKQNISINFQGLDFKYAMDLMAEIGDINIIVGEEVSGTVSAKIDNVPWDVTFQTLLDMKTLGADYNAADGVIRVHTPEKLKGQEEFKAERAESLKTKLALEQSVEPILAQLFKLYYIEPAQAKATLEDLFGLGDSGGGDGETAGVAGSVSSNLSITVENTTRSIIVRGYEEDLDIIDAVIKEIDVRTRQVLIEAFVVEADKTFSKGLGSRIAAMNNRNDSAGNASSDSIQSGIIGGAATTPGGIALGAAAGTVTANGLTGATSGIGIIKTFSTAALKIELEALESLGTTRIVSSPSVFTLNNQEAKITQGTEIPYTVIVDGEATIEFKEVALSLTVTPSIIGDGNVLLDILVSNDSPDTTLGTDEPAIKTNQIDTKLLISDGDIVVIGGIKIDKAEGTSSATPGLSKVPVVGNLFKGKSTTDELDEMLIFIAPRVVD
jgi:type IV pilus assembly protein PilQ